MIDQRIIDEIKNRIDIVEVIGDFVTLKKSGQSYKALSPFTSEKTPSFFISPAKGIYKDFSSGKGGDAINFIMEYDGLSYIEAIKYLGKKYGIEVKEKELTDEDIKEQNERDSIFIVLSLANEFFQNNLLKNKEGVSVGLSYLNEREFSEETIKLFDLGYSLEEWDAFYKFAISKSYSEEILEKAGLIIKSEKGIYDRFRGRVMFPIHNLTGKVIAFGARTLKRDKNLPKYINSPETEVYHKSSVLYGLHLAKKPIREKDLCFLVEGYTDVISLYQAGITNVVSSSGTALTLDQITLIKRYTDNVTILYDGDPAGLKAAIRGLDMLLEGGLNVRLVVLPVEDDPDSLVKKLGVNEMKEFLERESRDFISFKTNLYSEEFAANPIRKAEVIREIVSSISKIPDPIKRAVYIKETAKDLDMDENILVAEQNKLLIRSKRDKDKKPRQEVDLNHGLEYQINEQEDTVSNDDKIRLQEREGIRLLINYGLNELEKDFKAYDYFLNELEELEFNTPVYKEILELYKLELARGKMIDMKFLMEKGSEEVQNEVVNLTTERHEVSAQWLRHKIFVPEEKELLNSLFYQNILRLKFRINGKRLRECLKSLKEETDHQKQEQLQRQIAHLKDAEREIGNVLGIVVND